VNCYDSQFLEVDSVAPQELKSCANDARETLALARAGDSRRQRSSIVDATAQAISDEITKVDVS